MRIAVPRESDPHETRIALTPDVAAKLIKLGVEVAIERDLGAGLRLADERFTEAGCTVVAERHELLASADVVLRVGKPPADEIGMLREGALQVGFLDPFNERELVEQLAAAGVTAASVEFVPRTTYAQKMDALSSQHSLAGYYMVVLAAERLGKALPMMMTPAGTIQPARVFVIGAGVAGLQAIATAKRMGARVEAFDTRPVVAEQVQSLGARFVKIDLGDTGQTDQGYAKELTAEQQAKQREGMKKICAQADIVITTAQLFGRKAPVVVDDDMLQAMKPGAIVVDYAAASGGNVEGSELGEEVERHGVRVIGLRNYPGHVALDASRMYASNLYHYFTEAWDGEAKALELGRDNEIVHATLITKGGQVANETIRKHYGLEPLPADEPVAEAAASADDEAEPADDQKEGGAA